MKNVLNYKERHLIKPYKYKKINKKTFSILCFLIIKNIYLNLINTIIFSRHFLDIIS